MKASALVKNQFNTHEVTLSTNSDSKTLVIPAKPSGYGSLINGAELLLLSLATCYCNDIYREAAKRNIRIEAVTVECNGEFGGEGEPGTNFRYKPTIDSNATPEELEDLIKFTDRIAEIHKTLRLGLNIILER